MRRGEKEEVHSGAEVEDERVIRGTAKTDHQLPPSPVLPVVSLQPVSGDSIVTLWRLNAASNAPHTAHPMLRGLLPVPATLASSGHPTRARMLLAPVSHNWENENKGHLYT